MISKEKVKKRNCYWIRKRNKTDFVSEIFSQIIFKNPQHVDGSKAKAPKRHFSKFLGKLKISLTMLYISKSCYFFHVIFETLFEVIFFNSKFAVFTVTQFSMSIIIYCWFIRKNNIYEIIWFLDAIPQLTILLMIWRYFNNVVYPSIQYYFIISVPKNIA